jgi:hypothetical protein
MCPPCLPIFNIVVRACLQQAAQESREEVLKVLQGADMVFVTVSAPAAAAAAAVTSKVNPVCMQQSCGDCVCELRSYSSAFSTVVQHCSLSGESNIMHAPALYACAARARHHAAVVCV